VYQIRRKSKSPPTRVVVLRIAGLGLILAIASFGAYALGLFDYRHVTEHIAALRRSDNTPLFRVLFILVYAGLTSVGVPALPLTVAAGVLFGAMPGTAFSWVGATLGAAGFDAAQFQALVSDPEVKAKLIANTEAAVARGAFGAPTCFVGQQMFFGQDRLDFVREAATAP